MVHFGNLWVRFHGWYWYQSFIDGSNIWGVDRTDPWGPEMDHPPLGRSYLVVGESCYTALIVVTCKRNSSAAAKCELYILLPAEQRCSKNALQCCKLTRLSVCLSLSSPSLSLYIYIYVCIYIGWRLVANFLAKMAKGFRKALDKFSELSKLSRFDCKNLKLSYFPQPIWLKHPEKS